MDKKLPIGISSFEEIRTGNYYYVDKTHFIYKLYNQGKYYFLSRPRRFGKSLFLDTIRCAFEAKKELFEGLFLENKWKWEGFPVVRFSFDTTFKNDRELQNYISSRQSYWAKLYHIKLTSKHIGERNIELIEEICKKQSKQVVFLVDEYDKPILDNIENPEIAKDIREVLKSFYQTLKGIDRYLRFAFITGISKFAKVSLFSGLNQLRDISISEEYSSICGYTQNELEHTFGELIKSKKELKTMKEWYNGYSWNRERVYNPFDVLLYLQERDLRSYWFETGTPSFILKVLEKKEYHIPMLERVIITEKILSAFDIEYIEPEALLFQTGYLTIKDRIKKNNITKYVLSYPNEEVRISINEHLSLLFAGSNYEKENIISQIEKIIENEKFEEIRNFLDNLFSKIPYQWYKNTSKYEAFYCTVFYVFLVASGLRVVAEDVVSTGSIDLTVIKSKRVYIFEFKIDKGNPIEQVLKREYFKKYLNYKKVFAIGIVIDSVRKCVKEFEIRQIK